MTLPEELEKAEVAYSYKCELCGCREWHVKPSTKFHLIRTKKCSGFWVEEQWHNASFFEAKRKELHDAFCPCDKEDECCLTYRRIKAVLGGVKRK